MGASTTPLGHAGRADLFRRSSQRRPPAAAGGPDGCAPAALGDAQEAVSPGTPAPAIAAAPAGAGLQAALAPPSSPPGGAGAPRRRAASPAARDGRDVASPRGATRPAPAAPAANDEEDRVVAAPHAGAAAAEKAPAAHRARAAAAEEAPTAHRAGAAAARGAPAGPRKGAAAAEGAPAGHARGRPDAPHPTEGGGTARPAGAPAAAAAAADAPAAGRAPAVAAPGATPPTPPQNLRAKVALLWHTVRTNREYAVGLAIMLGIYVGSGIVSGGFTGLLLVVGTGSARASTGGWALFQLLETVVGLTGRTVSNHFREKAISRSVARGTMAPAAAAAARQAERREGRRSLRRSGACELATTAALCGTALLLGTGGLSGLALTAVLGAIACARMVNRIYQNGTYHCLKLPQGSKESERQRVGVNMFISGLEDQMFVGTSALVSYASYYGVVALAASTALPCIGLCVGAVLAGGLLSAGLKLFYPQRRAADR